MSRLSLIPLLLAFPACIAADDAADDTALATDESEVITIGNACFNQWATPQIASNNIFYPMALNADGSKPVGYAPNAGRFERGGVVYMTGYQLNVRLVTDGCTYIKSVALGSTLMPKDTWSGEFYQTFPSTTPAGFGQQAHDVFVHVTPRSEGRTDTLTVTVGRDKGLGTATYTIPLVRVERIEARGVNAAFSISESEIQNMFAHALYDAFDYGGTNSISGGGVTIFGYDPARMSVTVGGTEEVSFHFEFHADLPACDPVVTVDGRFRVHANGNGITISFPSSPQVTPIWPNDACVVAAAIFDDVVWEVTQQIGDALATTMTDVVNGALATDGLVNQFFTGATQTTDVVSIWMSFQVPSLAFHPPYGPAFTSNVRFPGGEKIGLLVSSLGVREYFTTPNNHWTIAGPNGVPRTGTPEAFWPGTHSLPRPSGTVWTGQPVGRLLARNAENGFMTRTHAYTPGCAITVDAASPWIQFGANDTIGGTFQGDRHYVRALFLSMNGILDGVAVPCESRLEGDIVMGP